jgi:hypothetical protein
MTLHDHGSLSEEAGKLAEILEAWLAGARQSAGAWAAAEPTGDSESLHSPECRVCPICRLLALLRGVRPETYEHLLDAAASLVAALRVSVEGAERSWTAGRPATVQRIDIG